ncbi:MAG: hypothetical protein R3B47_02405 [Bacteroidia bacterium]
MNASAIREIFDQYPAVSPATFGELLGMLDMVEVAKGEVFIARGKPEVYEYFLLEGICRSFLLSPDGEEVTIFF